MKTRIKRYDLSIYELRAMLRLAWDEAYNHFGRQVVNEYAPKDKRKNIPSRAEAFDIFFSKIE